MNTKSLITLLRDEIEKSGYKCYSPDLPQEGENCISIYTSSGENLRSINQNILYSDIPFYLLIRGASNDTNTRAIADSIFNLLDMKENIENDEVRIILISCKPANYAFRDENQRIHYNINATVKVEWKE